MTPGLRRCKSTLVGEFTAAEARISHILMERVAESGLELEWAIALYSCAYSHASEICMPLLETERFYRPSPQIAPELGTKCWDARV